METARDIAIIILAVESIIIGGLLIFLAIQIQRLIRMLQHEIKPILESTNNTVTTVRGTATFMSEHLTAPVVKTAGFVSGVGRVMQLLRHWPGKDGSQH